MAWVKTYGNGRVCYTSMGHRDDVMLPDTNSLDYGNGKMNSNEVSVAYRKHVTAGIFIFQQPKGVNREIRPGVGWNSFACFVWFAV